MNYHSTGCWSETSKMKILKVSKDSMDDFFAGNLNYKKNITEQCSAKARQFHWWTSLRLKHLLSDNLLRAQLNQLFFFPHGFHSQNEFCWLHAVKLQCVQVAGKALEAIDIIFIIVLPKILQSFHMPVHTDLSPHGTMWLCFVHNFSKKGGLSEIVQVRPTGMGYESIDCTQKANIT